MFTATVLVSVLLGLASIGSAVGKLTEQPRVVDMLTGIGVPASWLPASPSWSWPAAPGW